MRKVCVIGCGHVGSTLVHVIYSSGLVDELVVIDSNHDKVSADVLDIQDSASVLPTYTKLKVGDYKDLADADVVISALGHSHLLAAASDRFAELKANALQVRQVSGDLKRVGFGGLLMVITNPVDVITGLYQQATGLPRHRVFGTGTLLDSARLKRVVAGRLGIDPRSVEGYQLGEHGASQFTAWSTVQVLGRRFTDIASERGINLEEVEKEVRAGAFAVGGRKGYTNFAIATVAASLLQQLVSDSRSATICTHWNDEFSGYISSPALVGREGVLVDIDLPLTEEERTKLTLSSQAIKEKTIEYE